MTGLATVCCAAFAAGLIAPASGLGATPTRAGALVTPVSSSLRPAHFWRTAEQAIAITDRQPQVKRLLGQYRGVSVRASPMEIGLWSVDYTVPGRPGAHLWVEDRTGAVLQPNPWDFDAGVRGINSGMARIEFFCLGLGVVFLLAFFDFRRPLRLANLDVLVLLSFGASLALFDRGMPLIAIPMVYPLLIYLMARLLWTGSGRRTISRPIGSAMAERVRGATGERVLLIGLVTVVLVRVGFNLFYSGTVDVAYASVFGANSIQHGWPLYAPGPSHLDTYGPISYLAYLPFELLFPMQSSWQHDYLPAAHAATITFDLLTVLGLYLLGRRLAANDHGPRLGLTLALAWAAYPFTFFAIAQNTNDGLIAMLLVYLLLALNSPAIRGSLLGLAVAAKFAPLALFGLLAAATGDRRLKPMIAFAAATTGVVVVSIWLYLPAGGLHVFWDKTLGFQLQRHSFLSIWSQQPELEWLRMLVEAFAVVLSVGLCAIPRRRELVRVAALAGAVLIALQLSLIHWYYFYLVWFMPLVIVALLVPARASSRSTAVATRRIPTPEVTAALPQPVSA
jgi:hypothetical protein